KVRDQLGRKGCQGEHKEGRRLREEVARGCPEQKQQRDSEKHADGARAVEPYLRRRGVETHLAVLDVVAPVGIQKRKREKHASQGRMAGPSLKFPESPGLESGDQVFGLVVGERLGTDEPGALQHKKQKEQRNQNQSRAA